MLRIDLNENWTDRRVVIVKERMKFSHVWERLDFSFFYRCVIPNITGNWAREKIQILSKYTDRIMNVKIWKTKEQYFGTLRSVLDWEVREGLDEVAFKLIF